MADQLEHSGLGDEAADTADRGDQLRHRVLRRDRVIQHGRVQRPAGLAAEHPGLGDHGAHGVEDPFRRSLTRSLLRHNVNTVGWNPSSVNGRPAATFQAMFVRN